MKRCSECEQEKSVTLEYFSQDKRNKNGLQSACRECRRKYQREYNKTKEGKAVHKKGNIKWCQTKKGKRVRQGINQRHRGTIRGYLQNKYHNINRRCNNSDCWNYEKYGGRGIRNEFKSFDEFMNYIIEVLKINPMGLEIHRINNDDNYCIGNIEFLTRKEHGTAHRRINELMRTCA